MPNRDQDKVDTLDLDLIVGGADVGQPPGKGAALDDGALVADAIHDARRFLGRWQRLQQ